MDITETDLTGLDIFFKDLATRASGKSATVASLKIAELNDRDWSCLTADKMACLLGDQIHKLSIVWVLSACGA